VQEIASGTLIGPRIIASGPYLEGGDQPIPHLLVKTPADAAPAVDSLIKLGVDFIKVHGQLTRESYFAIARAARARGIPFAGHVSRTVGAAAASDSGQASIEHILAIPNHCTAAEMTELAPRFPVQAALGRCETADQAPLYARLKRNGTWVVPTLVAQVEVALWPRRELAGDSVARYLPDSLRQYVAGIFPMVDSVPPDADVNGRKLFAKRVEVTAGALSRWCRHDGRHRRPAPQQSTRIRASRGTALLHPRRTHSVRIPPLRHAGAGAFPRHARLTRHHRDGQDCGPGAADREPAGGHQKLEPDGVCSLGRATVYSATRQRGAAGGCGEVKQMSAVGSRMSDDCSILIRSELTGISGIRLAQFIRHLTSDIPFRSQT
jgi:hypothetical protein